MRYSEIAALPPSPQEAQNAVMDMLTVFLARGWDKVPVNSVLRSLHRQDYDLDRQLLVDLITDLANQEGGVVKRVSGDMIELNTGEPEAEMVSPDEGQRSRSKVEREGTARAREMVKRGAEGI